MNGASGNAVGCPDTVTIDCETITGVQSIECGCPTCSSEITFRYTANGYKPGETNCIDSGGGPTDSALVSIIAGGNTYFQGMISRGSDIVFNGSVLLKSARKYRFH